MVTPELPAKLDAVYAHVAQCYPKEGCGVLVHGPAGWQVRPMVNAYDRYHAKDPIGFPRTALTAYFFDPKEWLSVSEQAEKDGARIACIFHSHADVGAYFSSEDKAMAAPDGEPVMPGASYLVVAVDNGRVTAAKLFWWENGQFAEAPVASPA
jgi:[CysO sulfur-carrier protein]-S-L-cysteine hydrolase